MKQFLQAIRTGQTTVANVLVRKLALGYALVCVAALLVGVGIERIVMEFAEKNLLQKAHSRPELVGTEQ